MPDSALDSVIPRIAGVASGSRAAAVLDERTRVLELSQLSHDALLTADDPGGLPHALRAALATRVATINRDDALTAHYRALLDAAGARAEVGALADPAIAPDGSDGWLAAVVGHADLLATAPQDSTKATIEALGSAGVADADIVRLTQLIGFVTYQVRFAAGLRLINEQ